MEGVIWKDYFPYMFSDSISRKKIWATRLASDGLFPSSSPAPLLFSFPCREHKAQIPEEKRKNKVEKRGVRGKPSPAPSSPPPSISSPPRAACSSPSRPASLLAPQVSSPLPFHPPGASRSLQTLELSRTPAFAVSNFPLAVSVASPQVVRPA